MMTFELEWIRCGKLACKRCPHGPYWYAYLKERGKTKKWYIGKKLPLGLTEETVLSERQKQLRERKARRLEREREEKQKAARRRRRCQ